LLKFDHTPKKKKKKKSHIKGHISVLTEKPHFYYFYYRKATPMWNYTVGSLVATVDRTLS